MVIAMHDGPAHWGWWGLVGGTLWLAFWVLVIYVVAKAFKGRAEGSHPGSSALSILEERYARGEISREEFEDRRSVLKGS